MIRTKNRFYEFVTTAEYHNKPIAELSSRMVWEGFQAQTTAHGIPHVKNARGILKTTFWLLASLVCCALLIYYAYLLFDKFFSYPFNVKVEVVSTKELFFPAVTLCNHNPVRLEAAQQSHHASLRGVFRADDVGNDQEDANRTYGNGSGFQEGTSQSANGRPSRDSFQIFLVIQQYLATLSVSERSALGVIKDDFILDCEYSGAFCYSSDFTMKYYNPVYGNCFTYNLGAGDFDNSTNVQISHRPGPRYGLSVIMNIGQDDYFGMIAQQAGVRLTVHDQNTMPFPEDEGISLSPGEVTYVGMKLLTINRLSEPYGNCTDLSSSNEDINVYEEIYSVKYSNTACYKTCYQKYIIKRCGCADSALPLSGQALGGGHNPPCDILDEDTRSCMLKVLDDYQRDQLKCKCTTACTESTYTLTTSSAAWPSNHYKEELFENLAASNQAIRRILNDEGNQNKYKDNLVKAVIYFEEFNYEEITESPAYESFNLVSDLGGILGLFIGFSVMTIAEFIELGIDLLILNMVNKCLCRKMANSVSARSANNNSAMHNQDATRSHNVLQKKEAHGNDVTLQIEDIEGTQIQSTPKAYFFTS